MACLLFMNVVALWLLASSTSEVSDVNVDDAETIGEAMQKKLVCYVFAGITFKKKDTV